jgi:hypothetical protein
MLYWLHVLKSTCGRAVQHNYLYAADNSRILHVVPNAAGDRITRFLGGGAEIDEADVKRTGNRLLC